MKKQLKPQQAGELTPEDIITSFYDDDASQHEPFDLAVNYQIQEGIPLKYGPSEVVETILSDHYGEHFLGGWNAAVSRAQGSKPTPVDDPGAIFRKLRDRNNPYKKKNALEAQRGVMNWVQSDDYSTANEALKGKAPSHNIATCAAALTYARHGFTAIDGHALDDKGKSTNVTSPHDIKLPRGGGWEDRASDDPNEIVNFWSGNGNYPAKDDEGEGFSFAKPDKRRNVNIVFKPGCKLFVIDVDGDEGARNLAALEAELGPLPETVTSVTGSGGRHIILRSKRSIMNTASKIAPKIDIRGEGGQIVAEPSIHKTGNFYRWQEGCAPGQTQIADAPEAWEELCFNAELLHGQTLVDMRGV